MDTDTVVIPKRSFWPKKKRWRITLSISLIIVLLLAVVFTSGYLFLRKSLPGIKGEVAIPNLQEDVHVYRDAKGVPHIEAKTLHDLYVAQGYVTAEDRMFQMDLSRRQASGELSEVIGSATIEKDKFFRTLGLRRAAIASYQIYSSDAKQVLQWYADGVNAYLKNAVKNHTLPVEFTLAGYQPKEWTPIDSLTIGKYMAYDLGGHWEGQAFRYYLAQHFTTEKALDLFPSYPKNGPTVIQALKNMPFDISKSFANAVLPMEWNGSNDWVVSGKKTASGLPLLANDPHLALATPSIWYETHLKAKDLNVSGVIFAGVPGIILGHNQDIAWGVTNVGPDVQDLYIEKRNPDNQNEFQYKGKWEKATIVNEPIKVKSNSTIPFNVTITRHGPIISEYAHDNKPDTALALRWTALDPSTELQAVLLFNKAKNWDEFKKALTYFDTPAQNFVFADKNGTIAYRANGLIPLRAKGDSLVPVPGWNGEYEWKGFIPWDELPTVVNPNEGFIATANNKIVNDDYPYHITNTWAQPYREQRIQDVLTSKNKLTVKDMMNLQFDQYDLQAKEFVPILIKNLKQNNLRKMDKEALRLLENWDYVDQKDLGAPLLFQLWMEEIPNTLFGNSFPPEIANLFEGKAQVVDQLIRHANEGNPGPWIKDAGGLEKVADTSFKHAVDRAVKLEGNNPAKWQWGKFHSISFRHPLSAIKPLQLLFNAKAAIPMGGSRVTVEAAGWNESGNVDHGGAWRTVVDLHDPLKSYNIVGPGQSGHVLSKWYADQTEDWTNGNYHQTSMIAKDYHSTKNMLILTPKK